MNGNLPIHLAAKKFNISEIRAILKTLPTTLEKEDVLGKLNRSDESPVDILKK